MDKNPIFTNSYRLRISRLDVFSGLLVDVIQLIHYDYSVKEIIVSYGVINFVVFSFVLHSIVGRQFRERYVVGLVFNLLYTFAPSLLCQFAQMN